MDRVPEWLWKVVTILVIPLFIWVVKLETNNAVQTQDIEEIKRYKNVHGKAMDGRIRTQERALDIQTEKVKGVLEDLWEIKELRKAIKENTLALVRLEAKIDAANDALSKIRNLLFDGR